MPGFLCAEQVVAEIAVWVTHWVLGEAFQDSRDAPLSWNGDSSLLFIQNVCKSLFSDTVPKAVSVEEIRRESLDAPPASLSIPIFFSAQF